MSTTDNDVCREAIRRTLVHHAGDSPSAGTVAEATLGLLDQVAARLGPVIGVRGVDALVGRSLHLASKAFPWLALAGDHGDGAAPLAGFKARVEARETAAAIEAGCALLETIIELLSTLIGDSLTGRLLSPILVAPPPAPEKEAPS